MKTKFKKRREDMKREEEKGKTNLFFFIKSIGLKLHLEKEPSMSYNTLLPLPPAET